MRHGRLQAVPAVLVVDDRAENLATVGAILEPLDVEVVCAGSGFEALRQLLHHDFAAILLDIQMPEMDGFETARLIKKRERTRDIPIIFVTAFERDQRAVARGFQAGAVDYVTKPFDPDLLRARIRSLTDLWRKDVALRESEERFRTAFEHAPIGIALVGLDGDWLAVNRALCAITGRTAGDLLAEPPFDLERLAGYDDGANGVAELLAGTRSSFSVERRIHGPKANTLWLRVQVSLVRDSAGDPAHLVCQFEDVSAQRRTQETLERIVDQFQRALDAARDAVFIFDAHTMRFSYVNQGAVEQTGFSVGELLGMRPFDLAVELGEDAYREIIEPLTRGHAESASLNTVHQRRDGTTVPVELGFQTIGTVGRVRRIVAVARDVSEQRQAEERIAYLAFYDELTDLPNRAMFREHLDLALERAKRNRSSLAVLNLDLNRFKLVNDSLGHAAGDKLLRQVAERLRGAKRASDLLARVGGDEFLVLLSDLAGDAGEVANTVAAGIHAALAEPFSVSSAEFYVGSSVGIALYPDPADENQPDADQLLERADAAMYEAKQRGDATEVYRRPAGEPVDRLSLITRLRRSADQDEFVLHWQPIVDLKEERVAGVEALMRWRDPERGWVMPAEFMSLAEESGVLERVSRWALAEAGRRQREWADAGLDLDVAVNLSLRQLWKQDSPQDVLAVLEDTGADPERLILEISEADASHDPLRSADALARLKDTGLRLAVDDFGTGHGALAALRRMQFDFLKIDSSFVTGDGARNTAMLRGITRLARSLGMQPIAEGIERREQFARLRSCGCRLGQGWFFGRPLPAADIPEFAAGFTLPRDMDPWVPWEASRYAPLT